MVHQNEQNDTMLKMVFREKFLKGRKPLEVNIERRKAVSNKWNLYPNKDVNMNTNPLNPYRTSRTSCHVS